MDWGTATIVEKKGVNVWGVVWKIDLAAVSNLDRQEDVYLPKEVTIEMTDGTSLLCRTYQIDLLTLMAPMPAYKQVCIEGAREHGLPDYYIQKLMAIQDNGDTKTLTPTMVKMAEAKKD
ncbi:putative gamma-glutamylcyclotransferase-like [Apostichopus japonicus]|uniref:gamma-glutamylcyclotransferase n=1 Tax=Stichopus japonicus TaxID=307972 RepID=A0A2G8LCY9_STIJA|nr:putative gamma-glutamylcyclotransferase-like [Apostichopus japonicus]